MSFTADASDVLLTLAEVSVAFAGFASVVAIFQTRGNGHRAPFDLFRFWVMLIFSLATLLFSLVPFALHFVGLAEATVWGASSVLLALFVLGNATFIARLIRRRVPAVVSSLTPGLSVLANVVYTVILLAQLANLSGVFGRPGFGPYLMGLLLLLLGAGVNFVRLVQVGSRGG